MNLKERINNLEQLEKNWEKYTKLVESDQDASIIDQETKLLGDIDHSLTFKSKKERDHWLDVCFGFKFWEDFEELTLSIIEREEKEIENLLQEYYDVALNLAKGTDFETLYNAFEPFSDGWLDKIENFAKWWEDFSENEQDKKDYLDSYLEMYGEEFDIEKIKQENYAFECCCFAWFYKNNEESKSDLIECIFERFYQGLSQIEELELYQGLINGILNNDLFSLLKNLKSAIVTFEKDSESGNSTKGSLDAIEYAQSDIYEWVEENI